jgi:hypothetical protein
MKNENRVMKETKKIWGYTESFIVSFEIMILGFVIEIFLKGRGVTSPHWPFNLFMILALIAILMVVHFGYRSRPFVKWLSSVPCSVSAISVYALLVLLLGFIPQQEDGARWLQLTGLNHLKNSWPFYLIQFYFLIALGLVALRRGFPIRIKNLGFLLNHFGLWITLVAAGLGSGDQKSVKIDLFEDSGFINTGILTNQQKIDMPFSLKLIDFNIEFYNPKIAVADQLKGEIVQKHAETLPLIYQGFESKLIDWKIKVKEFLPFALKTDSGYIRADKPGSIAVAFIETKNIITGDTLSGWITNGSMMFEPRFLNLKRSKLLILTEPEPRKFESLVVVRDNRNIDDTIKLEVNKPYRLNGWKIYQLSYDTEMGKYSKRSIIEAVRDPWLPVVYTGILMLLGGAVYLFWLGRPAKEE